LIAINLSWLADVLILLSIKRLFTESAFTISKNVVVHSLGLLCGAAFIHATFHLGPDGSVILTEAFAIVSFAEFGSRTLDAAKL
jgi:hypothetical protein